MKISVKRLSHDYLRMLTTLSVGTCLWVTTANHAFAVETTPAKNIASNQTEESKALSSEQVQRFISAFGQIKSYYIRDVSDEALFEAAIRGMLTSLDPHSTFLDAESYQELQSTTQGAFAGLGIEIQMTDAGIQVISPIDDTPAHKAGIKPGDLIVKIDDHRLNGMSIKDAVFLMRGKPGTNVVLTILRKKESNPLFLKVTRDIITVQSVKGYLIDGKYGYIRLSRFQETTANDLFKLTENLKKEAQGKLLGMVLDLRNNPGGLLDSSIDVADAFLDNKPYYKHDDLIVFTKGRAEGSQQQAKITKGDILDGLPMVVLINSGSASGSEIVAGALQDYHRAVIVGTQTFGKGSVQTVLPLGEGSGIKLTTALYYTPAGRSIQATGITPDIIVNELNIPQSKNKNLEVLTIRESELQGHLEHQIKAIKLNNSNPNSPEKPTEQNPAPMLLPENSNKNLKADPKIISENPNHLPNANTNTNTNTKMAEPTNENLPAATHEQPESKRVTKDQKKAALIHQDFQLYEGLNVLKAMIIIADQHQKEAENPTTVTTNNTR